MERIDLVNNSVMVLLFQMTLLRWFIFLHRSLFFTTQLFWISTSDASICSTIDFLLNSQWDAPWDGLCVIGMIPPLHRIPYDYSHVDWDRLM